MLRDFLKVEKEDRLVEQQDASSGKANSTDVTEWIIVNKNGDKKGRVALFNQFTAIIKLGDAVIHAIGTAGGKLIE